MKATSKKKLIGLHLNGVSSLEVQRLLILQKKSQILTKTRSVMLKMSAIFLFTLWVMPFDG